MKPNSDETLSLVLLGPCHSMCCNTRAIILGKNGTCVLGSTLSTNDCVHLRGPRSRLPNQTNYDVLPGIQDTGQADSSNLFAGKTLVPPP